MRSWQDKLLDLDRDVIKDFLSTASCDCDNNCIGKLGELKEQGQEIVLALRTARLTGTNARK